MWDKTEIKYKQYSKREHMNVNNPESIESQRQK